MTKATDLISEARTLDGDWIERNGSVVYAADLAHELADALESSEARVTAAKSEALLEAAAILEENGKLAGPEWLRSRAADRGQH